MGKWEEAVAELKAEDKTTEAYLQELDQRIEKVKEENEEQLLGDFWKTYRLKELYKKGKYVVDLKTKAAVYAFSSFNKNELEDIVNVPGITIHELPIHTAKIKELKVLFMLKTTHFSNHLNAIHI